MRRVYVAAAVALGALAVTTSPASAQDRGLEIMSQAAARYQQVTALCADFTQHLVVPLLGDERTGTGRVCQATPNKFAMRFTDPDGDRLTYKVNGVVTVTRSSTWLARGVSLSVHSAAFAPTYCC